MMNKQLNIFHLWLGLLLCLGGLLFLPGSARQVGAATISVTTTLDENDGSCSDGDCSVRDAIATAVSGDIISVPSGTYLLTLGELVINKDLTLIGTTPAPELNGNNSSRVLQISGNVSTTLDNLVIANGRAVDGGGIMVSGGRLLLEDCAVQGNAASNNGGGIYISTAGEVVLNSGTISQNAAAVSGGGIFNMNGTLVQEGGTIAGNSAATGGGVYINLESASFVLNDGQVQQNSSTALETGGGGVYVAAGEVTINGGQIDGNSGVRGGGVQSANGSVWLNGGAISNNQGEYGGGVYLAFPEALLVQTGGEIRGNSASNAEFGGGGVLGFQGSMEMSGGTIHQNTAVSYGGGISIRFGELAVTGGTVANNDAGKQGGGIFAEQAAVTIANLQLGQNSANEGGGLYLSSLATLALSQTAVYSNTAATNGGGLLLAGAAEVSSITVSGNQAQENGGGLWSATGSSTLENVTFSQNSALAGGGIYSSGGTITIHNTILAGNTAVTGPECGGSGVTSDGYNLVQDSGGCTLTGNLTGNMFGVNPQLLPLTLHGSSTFIHPLPGSSPAVDAGDPVTCPGLDQHGRPRPLDGNLDETAVCDMGAFEYGLPLRIGDVTVEEADSGSTLAAFPVTLDFSAPVTVTVAYASSNQSALAEEDYTAVLGTLEFIPGETTKTILVPILGDKIHEDQESFLMTLSSPTYAFLAKAQGVGTILDNDPPIRFYYLPLVAKK